MMHCFECAAAMPDNMIYCLLCGAKLDGEAETVIRPKAPPKIVVMPPIPSRTEIFFTWVSDNRLMCGVTAAVLGIITVIFLTLSLWQGPNPSANGGRTGNVNTLHR